MSKGPEAVKLVEPKETSKQVVDANNAPELKPIETKTPQLSIETRQPDIEQAMNDLKETLAKDKTEKNKLAEATTNNPETLKDVEIFAYVSEHFDKLPPQKQEIYRKIKEQSRDLYNEVKPETLAA
jgi:hypothetical protein